MDNLKNVKNTSGGVLLLVKLQTNFTSTLVNVTFLHGCFSRFLNCTNSIKSRKASHAQSAFTYSKLTIETLEQGVKYVQS